MTIEVVKFLIGYVFVAPAVCILLCYAVEWIWEGLS